MLYGSNLTELRKVAENGCGGAVYYDDLETIKQIIMNKSILGRRHIFIVPAGVKGLLSMLENDNARFIVLSPSSVVDPALRSRCAIVHMGGGQGLAVEMTEFDKVILAITKGRNQLDITNTIRDFCKRAYKDGVALKDLCQLVIDRFKDHKKIVEIVEMCADMEHKGRLSSRAILCYEGLFLRLWGII